MDFAVIETGGKQYKVSPNQALKIEKLDVPASGEVVFEKVLLLKDKETISLGKPYLEGVTVRAQVSAQVKGPKIRVAKFRAKSRYRKVTGHRQALTEVRILDGKGKTKTPLKKARGKAAK